MEIVFKYRDGYTNGEWRVQRCEADSIEECIDFYGLGIDCDYQIISVNGIDVTNKTISEIQKMMR